MPSNMQYLYTELCQKWKTKGKRSRRFYMPDLHDKRQPLIQSFPVYPTWFSSSNLS